SLDPRPWAHHPATADRSRCPAGDLAAAAPRLTADQFPYRAIDAKASVLNGSQPFDLFRQREPMVRDLCERGPYGWIDGSRRGLPGHDGSSAVVRCLYIHEAPRCCDCATLQDKSVLDCGAIQKNPKRCKNLTECREGARGCGAGQRVPLAAPGECLCSAYMRARHCRRFRVTPSPSALLLRRVKPHRRSRRSPASCPARGRALCPTAADQQRGRPRHQWPACVCAQCGPGQQPQQSRLLGALLREQLIASIDCNERIDAKCDGPHAPLRAWTAAHNQPFSGKPKALEQHAIFQRARCLNFRRSPSPFGHGAGVAYACGQGIVRTGEAAMAKVLNEILLFSSMAVFVTGIVLAAARLLIYSSHEQEPKKPGSPGCRADARGRGCNAYAGTSGRA